MFAAIVSLIATVIWPLTLVALVLYFRKPLKQLIGRVTSFKGPAGIEGTFAGDLAGASRLVDDATNEVVEIETKASESESTPSEEPLVEADPASSARILNAWKRLETLMGPVSAGGTLTGIRDVPASARIAIRQLYRLRNRVAHGEQVAPDVADLYVNSINQTVLLIKTIRDEATESD